MGPDPRDLTGVTGLPIQALPQPEVVAQVQDLAPTLDPVIMADLKVLDRDRE